MKIGARFARSSCFLIVFAFFLIALQVPSSAGLLDSLKDKVLGPNPQTLYDQGKYAEARDVYIKQSQRTILSTRETTPARVARGVSFEIGERICALGRAIKCCEKLNETAKSQREKDSNQNQIESLAKEILRIGKSPYVYGVRQPSLMELWFWEDGYSVWPWKGETEEAVINSVMFSYEGGGFLSLDNNDGFTMKFDGDSFDQIFEEARKAKKRFETTLDSCPSSSRVDLAKELYSEQDGMRDRLESLLKVTEKAYFTDVPEKFPGGSKGVKVKFVGGREGYIPNFVTCYNRLRENETEFFRTIQGIRPDPKVNKVDLKLSSEAETQIEKARSILKESSKEEGGPLQTIGE